MVQFDAILHGTNSITNPISGTDRLIDGIRIRTAHDILILNYFKFRRFYSI